MNFNKKRVIIDCDPGVDDALTIIMALKSHSIIVDSITTVNGNVSVEQTTLNALKILEFMEREDIPVAKGAFKPIQRKPIHSKYIFGEDGLGNVSYQLSCSTHPVKDDAVIHILNRIETGTIDSIIAIGPLTNIAAAYKVDRDLMNSINEIIIMGGAIHVDGNITEFSEFNFYSDPHAVDFVLRSATNTTLIPLDVTTKILLTKDDIELFEDLRERNLLKRITKSWFEFSQDIGQKGITLHDPLALGYAIHKEFLKTNTTLLKICLTGKKIGHCEVIKSFESDNHYKVKYAEKLGLKNFKNYFIDQFVKKSTDLTNKPLTNVNL